MSGQNCIVDIEINGTPTKLIMDTGATLSLVDTRFADRIKTSAHFTQFEFHDAAGAKSETGHAALKSFKIAGVPVRVSDVQLSKVACYSSSGGTVVGLLGMDVLGQNWSIIDFGEQKLYIAGAR
jgi:predicted aspartyl protease